VAQPFLAVLLVLRLTPLLELFVMRVSSWGRALGWSLFHNVADSVGDRGLEHHALGLQAG